MEPSESISKIFTKFTNIINELEALGKVYQNFELVRKVLMSLSKTWTLKVTAVEEAKNLSTLEVDEFMSFLMTHKINMQRLEGQPQKKKGITFRAEESKEESTIESERELDNEEMEELAMLIRKFKRFMKKKVGPSRRKFSKQLFKKDIPKREGVCYKCRKSGYLMSDYPL